VADEVTRAPAYGKNADMPWGGRLRGRQRLLVVVGSLVLSDALLALAIWQATLVLRHPLGLGLPSAATVASVVPNTIAWVGLRAALGLYPGYGLGYVEELRRQTFALFATLAITAVFAFASQTGDSLSRLSLFAWALSLLLVAPTTRYAVKRAMMRMGLWCKPVVVIGAQEGGHRVLERLQREWYLGFEPLVGHRQRCRNPSSTVREIALGRLSSRGKLAASKEG
jgi:FlaA1/EpsC-like NDP-sugar epimerase